jgi:uncharacterized damage-inducible protein DinB
MRNILQLLALSSMASLAFAQNPQVMSTKGFFDMLKGNVLKSVDKMPESKYDYKPAEGVRTYSQVLAHIADAQYFMCGTAKGALQQKGIEKSNPKTAAELKAALTEAFAFCDSAYEGLTDAASAQTVSFLGQTVTKLSVLAFNTAHTYEHYGNLVTYMRVNGVVPPSSEGGAPAGKKK